jgi:hypothetical protein
VPRTNADQAAAGDRSDRRTVFVIGDGDLSEETARAVEASGARVSRLREPSEGNVREALGGGVDSVAVVARADAIVLRMALMVRAVSDDVPLLLTIFDATMAEEVAGEWPNTHVTSLADIVAPSLAGPCIDERFTGVKVNDGNPVGLVESDGDVRDQPIPSRKPRRVQAFARNLLTPYDKSAGLLLFGALGLLAVLALETVTAVFVLDQPVVDATYGSAKTLVTVGPNPEVSAGPGWYKLFTSATMLVALLFAAGFYGRPDKPGDRPAPHRPLRTAGRAPPRPRGSGRARPGRPAPVHPAARVRNSRGRSRAGRGGRERRPCQGARPAGGARPRRRPVTATPTIAAEGHGRGSGHR